ncbi:hypothetical protein OIU84_013909 [Salix udensis]|uniref:Uncharacterized protein n=1 Tax=Salix udensis TaxID=889485 RepID=A0AAD6JB08_9ROSI|nr:hypothetical protein OIU84_013909 [Salix udensis]
MWSYRTKFSFLLVLPAGGGGNEIHQHHLQRYQWLPVDERDGFISWLRGEFAAANAIIDSLCHHLRVVGEAAVLFGGGGYCCIAASCIEEAAAAASESSSSTEVL